MKFNGKMKELIQKIILGRQESKDFTDNSSSCPSSMKSDSSTTFNPSGETRIKQSLKSENRYDRIEEESSYAGTGSLNTSELSSKNGRDREDLLMSKEITLYGGSTSKKYFGKTKGSREKSKENDICMVSYSDKKKKANKRVNSSRKVCKSGSKCPYNKY